MKFKSKTPEKHHKMLSIIFIRHGEGTHNTQKMRSAFDITYEDAPLTELGIKQAKDLRHIFNNIKIDEIYCSPLYRCLQTAEYSINDYKREFIIDDRLIERLGADCVNMRKNKYELQKLTKNKLNIKKVEEEQSTVEYYETNQQMYIRGKAWFEELL